MSTSRVLLVIAVLAGLGAFLGGPTRTASAEVEIDVAVFYESLAPHGDWVRVERYGWAWSPAQVDWSWRPYLVGHWEWTEPWGWTWVSEEPWGWATYHYGRWLFVEDYGWLWFPGSVWAPAWVVFRFGDPWIGWAPLPPTSDWRFDLAVAVTTVNVEVNVSSYSWTFVPARYFVETDLRRHVAAEAWNPVLVQRTTWSTRYREVDGGIANVGVPVEQVERARGSKVQRRRIREAAAPQERAQVEADSVVLFKPRVSTAKSAEAPVVQGRRARGPRSQQELDAWAAQRREALRAHMEGQRKAIEQEPQAVAPPGAPPAGAPAGQAEEAAKRREAAAKALEQEQKRLEQALERQRRRLEQEAAQPQPPQEEPGKGKKEGEGQGQGKKEGQQEEDEDKDGDGKKDK